MRRDLITQDMKRMMLPRGYWNCNFNGIDPKNQEVVRKYLKNIDQNVADGIGFLFWGDNGRGKTGIMSVIGKECRRNGYQVLFLEAADMKRIVIKDIPFDEYQTIWERARSVKVLLLDDLGKGVGDSTGYGARLLDELIRHRVSEDLVTIITTNMTPGDMKQDLKKSTAHSLKAKVIPFEVLGNDKREFLKEDILSRFQEGA